MADIFLSYSRKDTSRIGTIVNFFEAHNFTVWWDTSIIPGDSWSATIESELNKATSVVVVWSENSVASEWVQIEAARSKQNNKYVPLIIDNVIHKIPLEFSRIEVANCMELDDSGEFAEQDVLLAALKRNQTKAPGSLAESPATISNTDQNKQNKFWHKWRTKISIITATAGIIITLINIVAAVKPQEKVWTNNIADEPRLEFLYLTLKNTDAEMPDTNVIDPRVKQFLSYPRLSNELISLDDSLRHFYPDSNSHTTTFLLIQNKGTGSVSDLKLQVRTMFINDSVLIRQSPGRPSPNYEQQVANKSYKSSETEFTLPASLEPAEGVLVPLFEVIKPRPGFSDWAFTSKNVSIPKILTYKGPSGKTITVTIRKMGTPITYKGGVEGRG